MQQNSPIFRHIAIFDVIALILATLYFSLTDSAFDFTILVSILLAVGLINSVWINLNVNKAISSINTQLSASLSQRTNNPASSALTQLRENCTQVTTNITEANQSVIELQKQIKHYEVELQKLDHEQCQKLFS